MSHVMIIGFTYKYTSIGNTVFFERKVLVLLVYLFSPSNKAIWYSSQVLYNCIVQAFHCVPFKVFLLPIHAALSRVI